MSVRPPVTTDEDIARVAAGIRRQVFREVMEIADRAAAVAEVCIRFSPVGIYCRHARVTRRESVKEAAQAVKLPQYVVNRIEDGDVFDLEMRAVRRYASYLGIDDWYAQWEAANAQLVELIEQSRALERDPRWQMAMRQAIVSADEPSEVPLETQRSRSPLRVVRAEVLRLEVTLTNSRPRIWRRIAIGTDSTLQDLHLAIQHAMGWTGLHMYSIEHAGTLYMDPRASDEPFDGRIESSRVVRLRDLAMQDGAVLQYRYDFGDGWDHEVTVQGIESVGKYPQLPVCLAGERACPPEDSGGVDGYEDKLKVLRNPRHREHVDIRAWFPPDFDPDRFDLEQANERLRAKGTRSHN